MTQEQNQPPIIAHMDDIDRDLSHRAYAGTSFTPERRGETDRQDYVNAVNGFYAEMWPLAKTDQQRALLAEEMERYRQGYIKHLTAYLHSHSSVVSTMIAGPSNFPVARQRKLGQWADNKVADLLAWDKKAQEAIKRKLLDARPQEEKDAAQWRAIERDIKGSLHVIEGIDAGREPYTRSSFVNSIAGKVERLALNGEVDLVDKALALVQAYNESHDKPAISVRHGFWTYGELARKKAAQHDANAGKEPEVIAAGESVIVVERPDIDRVQIVFDQKPDSTMIGALKREG